MSAKESYKPTTLGFAILGILQAEPRSGYAIRKVFEETALGQYSSSPGSIYPALRRLRGECLVRVREIKGSGGIFSLTPRGVEALRGWVEQPVDPSRAPTQVQELLLRFAFMEDLVDHRLKVEFLEAFRTGVEAGAEGLRAFLDEAGSELPLHGRLALMHGVEGYKTDARWATWALVELNKKVKAHGGPAKAINRAVNPEGI